MCDNHPVADPILVAFPNSLTYQVPGPPQPEAAHSGSLQMLMVLTTAKTGSLLERAVDAGGCYNKHQIRGLSPL